MGLGWMDGMVIIGHRSSKSTFGANEDHESQPRTGKIRKAKNRAPTQQIIQVDVKDQYKVDLTLNKHCLLC